jgi:uncharacterized integral membrane protein
MKHWILLALAILMLALGVVFSAINAQDVVLDAYFATWQLPLGVLVLGCILAGCVLAGVILWSGVIVPLRLRLAAARRELDKQQQAQVAVRERAT